MYERVVAFSGLGDFMEMPLKNYSSGMVARLAFSIAMIHSPRVVFLDEPTGGVDPITRRQFWEMIYEAAAGGTTVFVTTHYMDEAEYCDRIAIMDRGEIVVHQYDRETGDATHLDLRIAEVIGATQQRSELERPDLLVERRDVAIELGVHPRVRLHREQLVHLAAHPLDVQKQLSLGRHRG